MSRSTRDQSPPNVVALKWDILGRLNDIRAKRFDWVTNIINSKLMEDWRCYQKLHQQWRSETDAAINDLKAKGYEKEATSLIQGILKDPWVRDASHFSTIISTGVGLEIFQIIGVNSLEEAEPHLENTNVRPAGARAKAPPLQVYGPGQDGLIDKLVEDPSIFLSLAAPVDVNFDFASAALSPLTLSQATSQRRWVCLTTSGVAFCLDCPCSESVIPTVRLCPAQTTHDLIPRTFYVDPFKDGNAVRHFKTVHRETFEEGTQQMLERYGRKVTVHLANNPELGRWAIAANNFAIQVWYQYCFLEWEGLNGLAQPRRSTRLQPPADLMVDRSVPGYLLPPKTFTFKSVYNREYTILCTYPDCVLPAFTEHPLEDGRAIEHFNSHGLYIRDNHEVFDLFGFQVSRARPTTTCAVEQTLAAQRGVWQPRYKGWTRPTLQRMCVARGLDSKSRKAALVARLKRYDEEHAESSTSGQKPRK